eukprot:scpid36687/ scgid5721/ 
MFQATKKITVGTQTKAQRLPATGVQCELGPSVKTVYVKQYECLPGKTRTPSPPPIPRGPKTSSVGIQIEPVTRSMGVQVSPPTPPPSPPSPPRQPVIIHRPILPELHTKIVPVDDKGKHCCGCQYYSDGVVPNGGRHGNHCCTCPNFVGRSKECCRHHRHQHHHCQCRVRTDCCRRRRHRSRSSSRDRLPPKQRPDIRVSSKNYECGCSPVIDNYRKEAEQHKLAAEAMAQEIVALKQQRQQLEMENVWLKRDLDDARGTGKRIMVMREADLREMSKPELLEVHLDARHKYGFVASQLHEMKKKVVHLQNEAIQNQDQVMELMKLKVVHRDQQALVQQLQSEVQTNHGWKRQAKDLDAELCVYERRIQEACRRTGERNHRHQLYADLFDEMSRENARLRTRLTERPLEVPRSWSMPRMPEPAPNTNYIQRLEAQLRAEKERCRGMEAEKTRVVRVVRHLEDELRKLKLAAAPSIPQMPPGEREMYQVKIRQLDEKIRQLSDELASRVRDHAQREHELTHELERARLKIDSMRRQQQAALDEASVEQDNIDLRSFVRSRPMTWDEFVAQYPGLNPQPSRRREMRPFHRASDRSQRTTPTSLLPSIAQYRYGQQHAERRRNGSSPDTQRRPNSYSRYFRR